MSNSYGSLGLARLTVGVVVAHPSTDSLVGRNGTELWERPKAATTTADCRSIIERPYGRVGGPAAAAPAVGMGLPKIEHWQWW